MLIWISDVRKVENSSKDFSKNKANLWLFWNPLRRRRWGEGTVIKVDLQFHFMSYDWAGEKLAEEHCWNLLNQNNLSLMGKSLSLPGITHANEEAVFCFLPVTSMCESRRGHMVLFVAGTVLGSQNVSEESWREKGCRRQGGRRLVWIILERKLESTEVKEVSEFP